MVGFVPRNRKVHFPARHLPPPQPGDCWEITRSEDREKVVIVEGKPTNPTALTLQAARAREIKRERTESIISELPAVHSLFDNGYQKKVMVIIHTIHRTKYSLGGRTYIVPTWGYDPEGEAEEKEIFPAFDQNLFTTPAQKEWQDEYKLWFDVHNQPLNVDVGLKEFIDPLDLTLTIQPGSEPLLFRLRFEEERKLLELEERFHRCLPTTLLCATCGELIEYSNREDYTNSCGHVYSYYDNFDGGSPYSSLNSDTDGGGWVVKNVLSRVNPFPQFIITLGKYGPEKLPSVYFSYHLINRGGK